MQGDITLVGIDIGGTKTHLRAVLSDQETELDHIVSTSTWRQTGNVADAAALVGLVHQIYGGPPRALAIGAHGCDDTESCVAFRQALLPLAGPHVTVVNDSELLPRAAGFDQGIGVVAGTGSIAVGRDYSGKMVAAGGWGWIIGDEGGASGLVREAVRAIRDAQDRGERRDALFDAIAASFGVLSELDCSRKLGQLGSAASLGAHAKMVFAAATAGSAIANQVIRNGARALAELVMRVRVRGVTTTRIVGGGGVFSGEPRFFELFVEELVARWPQAEVHQLTAPPVAGAIRLARQTLLHPAPAL